MQISFSRRQPDANCIWQVTMQYKLFRTLRSRDNDVVIVGRKINLGYWEFGMGREWGGVEKGEVSSRVT
jgi:hypothetical protein